MNADAVSDLVLLLVCAALKWRNLRSRPAIAMAVALIGLAALLGVLRYSGAAIVWGPHRFFSLLAACAAFPLLAAALRWPDAPLAQRGTAVGRFVLVAGGVGVAMTVSGVALWSQVVPGLSAVLIVATVVQRRSAMGIAGALLLVGSFVVAATGKPDTLYLDFFNSTQALHYLLAGGLALLAWPGETKPMVAAA
jgi:hypothetical protein